MNNNDVYDWLDGKQTDLETRAVAIIVCRELHARGFSLRDIGEALGVSYQWVHRALLSHSP